MGVRRYAAYVELPLRSHPATPETTSRRRGRLQATKPRKRSPSISPALLPHQQGPFSQSPKWFSQKRKRRVESPAFNDEELAVVCILHSPTEHDLTRL